MIITTRSARTTTAGFAIGFLFAITALTAGVGGLRPTQANASELSVLPALGANADAAVSLGPAVAAESQVTTDAVASLIEQWLLAAPVAKKQVKPVLPPPSVEDTAKPRPPAKPSAPARPKVRWRRARVSWYGPGLYGNGMAGGGRLRRTSMVVAHRSMRFGTKIEFSYRGRRAIAVVRDRGPFIRGRVFDLGPGTAKKLKFDGVGVVRYRIIK